MAYERMNEEPTIHLVAKGERKGRLVRARGALFAGIRGACVVRLERPNSKLRGRPWKLKAEAEVELGSDMVREILRTQNPSHGG